MLRMTSDESANRTRKDWVSSRNRLVAWDIPTVALIAAAFMSPGGQTIIWTAALSWMGVACLLNARHCGRRHCYFTGPFFLVMAVLSMLHGSGLVSLGANGWLWLGVVLVAGGYGLLWKLPEYLWGTYVERKRSTP